MASDQFDDVTLVFAHGRGDDFVVEIHADGERHLASLELAPTDAGPRPQRFGWRSADGFDPVSPDAFVDIARAADRRRISAQTSRGQRDELNAFFGDFQLEVATVRTCPACANRGRYTPLTDDTAIATDGGELCLSCASAQLDRQLAFHGADATNLAKRFERLLEEVQDLERVRKLLSGDLDPELTRVDEMPATTDEVETMSVASLPLTSPLNRLLSDQFDELRPVQAKAVEAGLLEGEDLLVVSATATGKTLIGEIAGIDRAFGGEGTMLFLVPLVALANQTYRDLATAYGDHLEVALRVGRSRLADPPGQFDPTADVIVGTYEGIDHALRTGRDLGEIGTVVIDEVHTIGEGERGARLDGLIARLHDYCESHGDDTQWLYLSATVGNPRWLAGALEATLVEFEERPVPIERHLTVADSSRAKRDIIDTIVTRAYRERSSAGYRGQAIVFTNARRRCHELARQLSASAAAYHGGLTADERASIERRFQEGELAAVVTTAALGAGVDFPASHVIFERLAMGIDWLTVQEFEQMLGRAGRPDYHDRGVVYLLVEPGAVYHGGMDKTEDEVAFELLEGDMGEVAPRYDIPTAAEELLANMVVGGERATSIADRMVGELDVHRAIEELLRRKLIDGLEVTDRGRVASRHFLTPDEVGWLLDRLHRRADPIDVAAQFEVWAMDD